MSRLKPRPTRIVVETSGGGGNHAANFRAGTKGIDAASPRPAGRGAGASAPGNFAAAANHGHLADGEGSPHHRAELRPVAVVPETRGRISPVAELPRFLLAHG